MNILHVTITSVTSIIVLFLLAKLIGNRQVNQMSLFDYITGITIGSIAAEMATSLESDYLMPLTAMLIYGFAAAFIAFISCKSMPLRKFFSGTPILLLEGGKLYKKNLQAAKIDLNEFLTQCRVAGYFDLSQLEAAILESNGQISFMPKAEQRPVTPSDLQLNPSRETPSISLICDGVVLSKNLEQSGKSKKWLQSELSTLGLKNEKDVFFASVDCNSKLIAFAQSDKRVRKEIFE